MNRLGTVRTPNSMNSSLAGSSGGFLMIRRIILFWSITSITTLTVLSFERYMMVTRPLSSRHLSSKGAILSIMFIWSYSLALTTPPLLGWGNYVNEAANISCSVNWHEQSMNTLTYILFLFAMGQIVPFIVITFSYINIIRTIKQNSVRMGRVGRAETKVTAMVFVMIVAFTVAWTPYSVFALIEQFAHEGIISPGAGVIPALVAKSSICYDPLIYIGMNTQFRQSIKRLFGIHGKGGHTQTEKGYDNTILLPTNRFSRINDNTRFNSSESNVSTIHKKQVIVKDKKITVTDDLCDYNNSEINYQINKIDNINLCTIQENKTASDNEKSGETIYEEDNSNGKQKLEVFGENYQLFDDTSPVLTIIDSEHLAFSKTRLVCKVRDANAETVENVYGNKAFVEHSSDITSNEAYETSSDQQLKKNKRLQSSYSTDIAGIQKEPKKRKLSSEAIIKGSVTSNFFEDPRHGHESFKTYLYMMNRNLDGDDNFVV
ncbi:uncharacterized protein LOC105397418 [Plutella xylostella]|uniref:uncharacterized protein LOC105397418 n=1 Tax=Plutella xylostella TaxID=51655 RepID=UPI002032F879|nr:uncharacterized protein LOC105397418 [Plutella xylostella]